MAKDGKRVMTFGPKSGECVVCDKLGSLRCSRCQVDFYCGKEHQVQDWPRHRQSCGSIELRVSPEVGRCVVATKDIPAGSILMREIALVASPNSELGEDQLLCVGCFMPPRRVRPCALCGWPVCGEACSKKEIHQPECAAFQRAKFKLPKGKLEAWDAELWTYLAALRTTLAFEDESRRDILQNLQYEHPPSGPAVDDLMALPPAGCLRLWMNLAMAEQSQKDAAQWVRDVAGITWLSAKAVRRGAGVWSINSASSGSTWGRQVSSLLPGISMVQHSCRPNVEMVVWERVEDPYAMAGVTSNAEHVLVASRDIARGEHLGVGYAQNFLLGASQRRMKMFNWNFLCRCELCSDPSQRGLYLDGWCCRPCSAKKNKAFPVLIHDLDDSWSCSGCGEKGPLTATREGAKKEMMMYIVRGDADSLNSMAQNPASLVDSLSVPGGPGSPHALAKGLEQRFKGLLKSTSKVPLKEWERFIADALWPRGPLHPTHSLVLQAKKAIVELDEPKVLVDKLTAAEMRRLVQYCRDLRAVGDKVYPGTASLHQPLLLIQFGLVGAQVKAQLNDAGRSRPHPDTEDLLGELEELSSEMLRAAISPNAKHQKAIIVEHVAGFRKNLSTR